MSLSKHALKLPIGSVVKDFEMKNFTDQIPTPGVLEYKYSLFDKESEQVRLTITDANQEAARIVSDADEIAARLAKKTGDLKAEAEADRQSAAQTLKEAEELKANAYQDGHKEGYADGHKKGYPEGQAAGHKDYLKDSAPLIESLTKVEDLYQELWAVNEPSLVQLACKIGELVALKEISNNMDTITAAYQAALNLLHDQQQVIFRLHPEDLEYLETARRDLEADLPALTKLSFESDPDLSRGDLIMDTESGRLDATIKRRIANVTPLIEEVIEERFELDW